VALLEKIIFWRTRRYKSIHNLKIDTIEMLMHHSIDAFFSALKLYMTWHAIYWQKAWIKSKTSTAQPVSQPCVYIYNWPSKFTRVMAVCVGEGVKWAVVELLLNLDTFSYNWTGYPISVETVAKLVHLTQMFLFMFLGIIAKCMQHFFFSKRPCINTYVWLGNSYF
jgi:hypothetical protein